jgi:hypothetical protein
MELSIPLSKKNEPLFLLFPASSQVGPRLAMEYSDAILKFLFPLSRRAFLTLTHDLKLIEILEKADRRKRDRLLAATPEVQVRSVSKAQVRAFNRGHVRHAHRWIFATEEMDCGLLTDGHAPKRFPAGRTAAIRTLMVPGARPRSSK